MGLAAVVMANEEDDEITATMVAFGRADSLMRFDALMSVGLVSLDAYAESIFLTAQRLVPKKERDDFRLALVARFTTIFKDIYLEKVAALSIENKADYVSPRILELEALKALVSVYPDLEGYFEERLSGKHLKGEGHA